MIYVYIDEDSGRLAIQKGKKLKRDETNVYWSPEVKSSGNAKWKYDETNFEEWIAGLVEFLNE